MRTFSLALILALAGLHAAAQSPAPVNPFLSLPAAPAAPAAPPGTPATAAAPRAASSAVAIEAVPTGPCKTRLSADRSTIVLVDAASGQDREHLAFAPDRVQDIYSSEDSAWTVAVYKVRGENTYGVAMLDLAGCRNVALKRSH